jgi:hypothetical protein
MPTGLCYRRALHVTLALWDLPVDVSVADLLATVANREITRIGGRTGPTRSAAACYPAGFHCRLAPLVSHSSVDSVHQVIHNPRPRTRIADMREAGGITTGDAGDAARAELLMEAMADLRSRASRYVREPADDAWNDLVLALARIHGDSEAYDLLRAIEIRLSTTRRR